MNGTPEQRMLIQIVLNLPVREKQVLYLRDYEELTDEQIGEVLALSEAEVRQLWDQAKERIRRFARVCLRRARTRIRTAWTAHDTIDHDLDETLLGGDVAKAAELGRRRNIVERRIERLREMIETLEIWGSP